MKLDFFNIKGSKLNVLALLLFVFIVLFSLSYATAAISIERHYIWFYYFRFWITLVPLILGFLLLYINVLEKTESKWFLLIFLFVLALAPRLLWVLSAPTIQTSDFEIYLELAQRAMNGDYSWTRDPEDAISFYFSWFLSGFGKVFGLTITRVAIMNTVAGALLAPIFFLMGIHLFNDRRVGICAALIVAFFPSYIFFCSIAGNQVLSTTLGYAAVLLSVMAVKKNSIGLGLLGGAVFALAYVIRTADTMVLIIATLFYIAVLTIKKIIDYRKDSKPASLKKTASLALPILVTFFCFFIAFNGIASHAKLSGKYQYDTQNAYNDYLYFHLAAGQDVNGFGRGDEELTNAFETMPKEEFKAYVIERIKANVKNPEYLKMQHKKFEYEWMNWYSYWAVVGDQYSEGMKAFVTIEKGYLFTIALLLLVSVLSFFRKPIENFVYFCAITIAGYSALMFLVIRNDRYRFTAEGAIILLAGVGLCFLITNFPIILKRVESSRIYGRITSSNALIRLAEKNSLNRRDKEK